MFASLIGGLGGLLGSALPEAINFFAKKRDQKFELQKMEKAAELRAKGFDHELIMYQAKADDEEHKRLIEHDIQISKGSGWINALQRSVRPVITYCFFGLFACVEVSILVAALQSDVEFTKALTLVWDQETQAIFSAVIGFWFGDRRLSKKFGNRTI